MCVCACVDTCHVWKSHAQLESRAPSSKIATYCTPQAARVAINLRVLCVYACVNVCHASYNHTQLAVGQLTSPAAPLFLKNSLGHVSRDHTQLESGAGHFTRCAALLHAPKTLVGLYPGCIHLSVQSAASINPAACKTRGSNLWSTLTLMPFPKPPLNMVLDRPALCHGRSEGLIPCNLLISSVHMRRLCVVR